MTLEKLAIYRVIVMAGAFAWGFGATAAAEESNKIVLAQVLARQSNNEGQVTVQVTPQEVSAKAATWRFAVLFDTHVKALNEDLLIAASLRDANGHEEAPSAWEGDPAGGHHRKGVLVFKPMGPLPASITLKIRGVGGVAERSFVWSLAGQ
jgi:hypothetical protein